MLRNTVMASALLSLFTTQTVFASEETDALRKVIEQQQQVLVGLEKRLNDTEKRIEKTAEVVDQATEAKSATTIGGYGELHYNNITDNKSGEDKKAVDFHRFVLFFGHEFTDRTRFFSELELEHSIAGKDQKGEVELEQAYIEHDINNMLTAKAGLFLVPVGIINETHEPPTFYGVERNPVEKNILPATWWEAGAALTVKAAPGLAFDGAITSGLKVDNTYNIRSGRQKVAKADASDLAYTARVKYTAVPGLELSATAQYQSDITQSTQNVDKASAVLLTAHAIYSIHGFTVKGLYAQWDIDGEEVKDLGRDKQRGFYIEPSYRINDSMGVFARYNEYDNNAGDNTDTKITQTNAGVNYWLHENVVLKADYEIVGGADDKDGFNLGVGYQF